jgi:PHD/YefM family antitoxin component YafN of YafNO toxin-antitoxin module
MTAKTISASAFRANFAEALDAVSDEDILIVTRRGKGKKERAIVDLDRLEDLLAASDPDYLEVIRLARQSDQYLTHEEVFGHL